MGLDLLVQNFIDAVDSSTVRAGERSFLPEKMESGQGKLERVTLARKTRSILKYIRSRPPIPHWFTDRWENMFTASRIVEAVGDTMRDLQNKVPSIAHSPEVAHEYQTLKNYLVATFKVPGTDDSRNEAWPGEPSAGISWGLGISGEDWTPALCMHAYTLDADYYVKSLP